MAADDMCYNKIYSYLFYISLFILFGKTARPYKGKPQHLTDFKDCDLPTNSYDKDSGISHTLKLTTKKDGKIAVAGSFIVSRKVPSVMYNARSFQLFRGGKRAELDLKNLTCNSPLIMISLQLLNIKYERKRCVLLPGNYTMKPTNSEDFRKIHGPAIVGGNALYEFEMFTKKGVAICFNMTCIT